MFSKHCHSYLITLSCHAPLFFEDLISEVGTRLRMVIHVYKGESIIICNIYILQYFQLAAQLVAHACETFITWWSFDLDHL